MKPPSFLSLLPVMGIVFLANLVIGLAMPVLPLHLHQGLGQSAFVVGLIAGSQFAASLASRPWAGHVSDSRGPKRTMTIGLWIEVLSGLLYLLSTYWVGHPPFAVALLLVGRLLLGGAESLVITGALSWGLALLGAHQTGKIMARVGTALYAAFASGAPLGSALYTQRGFAGIALAAVLLPLIALVLLGLIPPVSVPRTDRRPSVLGVAGIVWRPGLTLAISGIGFSAVTTFVALLFVQHAWGDPWWAFTLFSSIFIVGRLTFSHLPDRYGGARVALVCILIEALGLALLWLARTPLLALVGITLTGLGYSLVYPSFGVEAIRRAPADSRGLAMGAYTAFLDLSLGLSGPLLGAVAGLGGLQTVFLVSTLIVLSAALLTLWLLPVSRGKR